MHREHPEDATAPHRGGSKAVSRARSRGRVLAGAPLHGRRSDVPSGWLVGLFPPLSPVTETRAAQGFVLIVIFKITAGLYKVLKAAAPEIRLRRA